MKKDSISARLVAPGIETGWENVTASFERFCLTAGIATLTEMMEQDAVELCGSRHERAAAIDAVIAGAARPASSASMEARQRSTGHGFAVGSAMSSRSRAGRQPRRRTGLVGGR